MDTTYWDPTIADRGSALPRWPRWIYRRIRSGQAWSGSRVGRVADGKDEIVCAGTNHAPKYRGATIFILDENHRAGAAIDPLTSPGYPAVDTSLVRVVFPIWPDNVLQALGTSDRLVGFEARSFSRNDGTVGIQVNIGYQDDNFFSVDFDTQLRPIFISISDKLQTRFTLAGIGDHACDRAWLDGHVLFESGRMVAAAQLP